MTIKTPVQLKTEITADFPDNTTGLITPALLRTVTTDIVDTYSVGAGSFNVKQYGALGDGATDDTTAINLAIAAFNSAGEGLLYFPAGNYLVPNGGLTTITASGIIQGDGGLTGGGSTIKQTSGTATLLIVNASGGNLLLSNFTLSGQSVSVPTTSLGLSVLQTSTGVNYERIGISNFATNLDSQGGFAWSMAGCYFEGGVTNNVRIRNLVNTDIGDWAISNCVFTSTNNYTSAPTTNLLKVEGSGGGKVINSKFNWASQATSPYANGINIDYTGTVDFLVANLSMENWTGSAILAHVCNGLNITNIQTAPRTIGAGDVITISNSSPVCVSNINSFSTPTGKQVVNITGFTDYQFSNIINVGGFNGQPNIVTAGGVFLSILDFNGVPTWNIQSVGSLPGGLAGGRSMVSNSNATLAAGLGNIVAAGGTNVVPVYYDGTNWRIG